MKPKSLILYIILCFSGLSLLAGNGIKSGIKPTNIFYKVIPNYELSIETALSNGDYLKLTEPALNLGFFKGGVWLKLKRDKQTLLAIEHPPLDFGIVYKKDKDNKLIELAKFGDEIQDGKGTTEHRYPVIDLEQNTKNGDSLYIYVRNRGEQFYLPILFWDKVQFQKFNRYEFPLIGGYFGIIIFAIFFNLFITLVLKEKNILSYTIYLVCLLILQASLNGFGGLWFWGNSEWLSNRVNVIFASASIFFLLNFTLGFLPIEKHLRKSYLFIYYSKIVVGINGLISIFLPSEALVYPIIFINVITFVFGLTIIPISFIIYRKYFKEARYFLLAFILLILGVFAFVLRNAGVIPNNFFSENGLQLGSSFEAILLTFAIIDKFKAFREQAFSRLKEINIMKEKANLVLEQKVKERTSELATSNKELRKQKDLVEEQNQEIRESINYGEKIQSAILPTSKEIGSKVQDAFVFFKPKDIVSGDFYWVSHKNEYSFYVVADCTGHGVPGAFMSMIGNTLLNQVINKEGINEPAEILNQLKSEVINALSQKGEIGEQKDGMDLSLVRINHTSKELVYAGANNPIYIISEENKENYSPEFEIGGKKLISLKPVKHPIGYQSEENIQFTSTSINLKEGDEIYLFTDGYPDQFGGEKGKKLKYKKLKQLLIENEFNQLNSTLPKFLKEWMETKNIHNEPIFQVDDICILGLKI